MKKSDLVILGSGPGGYVAAIRGAQLGLDVTLIEEKHLGGVCLNWGCIPTKALLHGGECVASIQKGQDFGVHARLERVDLKAMVAKSRQIAKNLSMGVASLLRSNGVRVVMGRGSFLKPGVISIDQGKEKEQETIEGKAIIIATGGRPYLLPSLRDHADVWDYQKAMLPQTLPNRLAIVGGGAIGVEFASFYNALGVDVTIIEQQESLLPSSDLSIVEALHRTFEKRGIRIITRALVLGFHPNKRGTLRIQRDPHQEHILCDKVICATGIHANLDNMNLEDMHLRMERNHIWTKPNGATNIPNLYAIGDVAGAPWLAHKSSHQGIVAVESIHTERIRAETTAVQESFSKPSPPIAFCTYTSPQTACVGLTEKEALEAGYRLKKGLFPMTANGRALATGGGEGFVKVLFDQATGKLLGAHLFGDSVSELIASFLLAMRLEATEEDFFATVFPHPTLSEAIGEATLDAFGQSLHIFRRDTKNTKDTKNTRGKRGKR